MRSLPGWMAMLIVLAASPAIGDDSDEFQALASQFVNLPMAARTRTGPLFWLHGSETKAQLEGELDRVAEGGNGCFTAESRPHSDWLGLNWYRDLDICLQAAKKRDLKMWIFDERWWPSGEVAGRVPQQYWSKSMQAAAADVEGPKRFSDAGYGTNLIAVLAGRDAGDGIDGASLVDLTGLVRGDALEWDAPAGKWKVMKFTWAARPRLVDGASKDCVDWYIKTVYQPHYDRFKDDFGQTIVGYFYDEPETHGDWGTEVIPLLKERKVDWAKALVSWKFTLAGEDQVAAKYQYQDAFAEAWGRTLYGGLSAWCREHKVVSMGHFLEHGREYLNPRVCAGNMFQLQKYSDMGGIDLVCGQGVGQIPKLGSSISHAYHKANDLTMCEIFGGYGQGLSYPQMKSFTDQMQVGGVNFLIPHSFNPRAPFDTDYPPYFYNGGFEPRWPLYRVWADYTNRLSLMLTGGRHVCPVALLFAGNSVHVGRAVTPESMTDALQSALYDCDWIPYDVFEKDATLDGAGIRLHQERYRVLMVPPVEVIPYDTLAKGKEFFDNGGVVVGYGFLPSKSATLGKSAADITLLCETVWGGGAKPGPAVCKTNVAGGRSYLLPDRPSAELLQNVLAGDAGVHPTLEVLPGDASPRPRVLHRNKAGRDVFLVFNQDPQPAARPLRLRLTAAGEPECWDPMRNEMTTVPFRRTGDATVEIDLKMAPAETVLLVFAPHKRPLPMRLDGDARPARDPIEVVRDTSVADSQPQLPDSPAGSSLKGYAWVWFEANAATAAPPGTRYFRGGVTLPADKKVKAARFVVSADNRFELLVNGGKAGASNGGDSWSSPQTLNIARFLRPGANQFAVVAVNETNQPSPAGLIGRYEVEFDGGGSQAGSIDATWKAFDREQADWEKAGFDDAAWPAAKVAAPYGQGPWARSGPRGRAVSPIAKADTFHGRCDLPAGVDLSASRVCLEADDIAPEQAAHVTVNGAYAGGFIGKPFRLDVTRHLKAGANRIDITPFAPKTARLVVY